MCKNFPCAFCICRRRRHKGVFNLFAEVLSGYNMDQLYPVKRGLGKYKTKIRKMELGLRGLAMYNIEQITPQYLEKVMRTGGKGGLNFIAEMDPTVMDQVCRLKEQEHARRLPLYGMPVFVKDNIDVKGLHTTAGSLALDDNVADQDAPVIQNLRKNGALVLGKTNMTEFANYTTQGMPGGYSSRGGQVIHAVDPNISPSGSSSGSGVAVASGMVDAAIGTETSFSVIACAQDNGVCGLKPPAGVLPADGIIPIARTLDSAGVMANCFSNALAVYGAMRDDAFGTELISLEAAKTSELKLAVNTANRETVSKGQLDFLETFLEQVKTEGGKVDDLLQAPTPWQAVIMKWEFKPHLEEYLRTSNASRKTLKEIVAYYESHPETMMKYGDNLLRSALEETQQGISAQPYLTAMLEREKMRERVLCELKDYDAAIMTGPSNIMHFCGLPCVTVISSTERENHVKRGLILYGADERRLYKAALAIEKIVN